jgi:hypothetical protein
MRRILADHRRVLRAPMFQLALAAMLLRALLPAGWMPDPAGAAGGAALVICTVQGPLTVHTDGSGKSTPHNDQGQRQNDFCPFAAAAHFGFVPVAAATPLPAFACLTFNAPHSDGAICQRNAITAHGPRAPPSLA